MNQTNNTSLVTIAICTYNSGNFILETLESIKSQTYTNMELIVSDDASHDDTLKKVREWIGQAENQQRFSRAEIMEVSENTGVSANANRGLKAAGGEWIKFLGGDDTLKPNCIADNMLWIKQYADIKVLFSQIDVFRNTFEPSNLIETTPWDHNNVKGIMARNRNAQSQYKMLLLCDRIHYAPSVFLHRKTILSLGGFDERFKLLEDYPLWLKLTKNGHRLCFMEKVTVNYRQHSSAINNTGLGYLINPNYFKSEPFRRVYTYPYLPADVMLYQRFSWYASQVFRCNWLNKNNMLLKILLSIFTNWLNPFKYYIYLKIHFNRSLKNNEFYMD